MTIHWPEDGEQERVPGQPAWLKSIGIMPLDGEVLPGPRTRSDVALVLGFILLLVVLFAVLWVFGPLPRVFPQMCSDGCLGSAPIRMP
jgi:hypothetical protein